MLKGLKRVGIVALFLPFILIAAYIAESEIIGAMSESYDFDKDDCSVNIMDDGSYIFYRVTSAPFPDNIEGH